MTIYNQTPANFTAIAPGGEVLGHILSSQVGHISAPFVPSPPTYIVLLDGDNGKNALIVNKGEGPTCSDQLSYHHCIFSQVTACSLEMTIAL